MRKESHHHHSYFMFSMNFSTSYEIETKNEIPTIIIEIKRLLYCSIKLNLDLLFKFFGVLCCCTHKDFSIHVSITTVGLMLTKLGWFLFLGFQFGLTRIRNDGDAQNTAYSPEIVAQQPTFLNLGFSLALASSSSKYVLTPILMSMTQGALKSLNKSCSCR